MIRLSTKTRNKADTNSYCVTLPSAWTTYKKLNLRKFGIQDQVFLLKDIRNARCLYYKMFILKIYSNFFLIMIKLILVTNFGYTYPGYLTWMNKPNLNNLNDFQAFKHPS